METSCKSVFPKCYDLSTRFYVKSKYRKDAGNLREKVIDLSELLVGFSLHSLNPDKWKWLPDTSGLFSVKSCYQVLLENSEIIVLDSNVLTAIKHLWRNDAPSKVLVFGWRLFLDRLPTSWIGKSIIAGVDGWNHFKLFGEMVKMKNSERISHLIWLATTWNIWKLRNNMIFHGAILNASSLLDDIKAFSWAWVNGRYGHK
ncbi:uncharacterized protein LOC123896448 [Trifolium pratense]|uniref:uncharacterized protein LOC123896448 n=1 Tax=Trifolium pratense TaxID=57577 RepID=UPI001E693BA1|nr:uncharacterized protein LOC123896448 [Trifolium pratense]